MTQHSIRWFLGVAVASLAACLANSRPASAQVWWWYNPYASELHGLADLVRAQGDFLKSREEANRMRIENRKLKLEARKAELEHKKWELDFRVEYNEKLYVTDQQQVLIRLRHNASIHEIWSGYGLQVLLENLRKDRSALSQGESKAIDPDVLRRINVSFARGTGHVAVIKSGKLTWPLLLRERIFENSREKIEKLIADTIQRGSPGEEILELKRQMEGLKQDFSTTFKDRQKARDAAWDFHSFARSRKFLDQLDDALIILEDPSGMFCLKPP
jgi:hypothetical protein